MRLSGDFRKLGIIANELGLRDTEAWAKKKEERVIGALTNYAHALIPRKSKPTFTDLPYDVHANIAKYLPRRDRLNASETISTSSAYDY